MSLYSASVCQSIYLSICPSICPCVPLETRIEYTFEQVARRSSNGCHLVTPLVVHVDKNFDIFINLSFTRYGRKITLCVSSIFYFLAVLATTWSNSFAYLFIMTFIVGFFSVGNFMSSFVNGTYMPCVYSSI